MAACYPEPRPLDGAVATDGGVDGAIGARLSQIQSNFFDRHCVTDCHATVGAASNMPLSAGRSYSNLVNVRSQQITSLWRVLPGKASDSYLIKKMEGTSGIVGEQMPRLAPARPSSEIDQIRAWINKGALDD